MSTDPLDPHNSTSRTVIQNLRRCALFTDFPSELKQRLDHELDHSQRFTLVTTGGRDVYRFTLDIPTFVRNSSFFAQKLQRSPELVVDPDGAQVVIMSLEHAKEWKVLIEALYDPM